MDSLLRIAIEGPPVPKFPITESIKQKRIDDCQNVIKFGHILDTRKIKLECCTRGLNTNIKHREQNEIQ